MRRKINVHAKKVNEIEHLTYQRLGERFYRLIDLLRSCHFYLLARRQWYLGLNRGQDIRIEVGAQFRKGAAGSSFAICRMSGLI
jgi:hypothetical protein